MNTISATPVIDTLGRDEPRVPREWTTTVDGWGVLCEPAEYWETPHIGVDPKLQGAWAVPRVEAGGPRFGQLFAAMFLMCVTVGLSFMAHSEMNEPGSSFAGGVVAELTGPPSNIAELVNDPSYTPESGPIQAEAPPDPATEISTEVLEAVEVAPPVAPPTTVPRGTVYIPAPAQPPPQTQGGDYQPNDAPVYAVPEPPAPHAPPARSGGSIAPPPEPERNLDGGSSSFLGR